MTDTNTNECAPIDMGWRSFLTLIAENIVQETPINNILTEYSNLFTQVPDGHIFMIRQGINLVVNEGRHHHEIMFMTDTRDGQRRYFAGRYDDERQTPSGNGTINSVSISAAYTDQGVDQQIQQLMGEANTISTYRHSGPDFIPAWTYWQIDPQTGTRQKLGTPANMAIPLLDDTLAVAKNQIGLFAAIAHNDADRVQARIDQGADINVIDFGIPTTPLGYAILKQQPDMVATLLAKGADPNLCADDQKITPLMDAAMSGNVAICQMLIKHPDCNLLLTDQYDQDVMDYAQDFQTRMIIRPAYDRANARSLLQPGGRIQPPRMANRMRLG